jgi:hypothetical protein
MDILPDEILLIILKELFNVEVLYSLIDVNHRLNKIAHDSIFHKIKWLNLESSSMERILLTTNYPNLYGLGLYNISIENALPLFIGKDISILSLINREELFRRIFFNSYI